jgi:hypothetical protein
MASLSRVTRVTGVNSQIANNGGMFINRTPIKILEEARVLQGENWAS